MAARRACLVAAAVVGAAARPYASPLRVVAPPPRGLVSSRAFPAPASLTGAVLPPLYAGGASLVEVVAASGALSLTVELELDDAGCGPRLAAVLDGKGVFAVPASACVAGGGSGGNGSALVRCAVDLVLPKGAGSRGAHVAAVYATTACAAPGSAALVGGDVLSVSVAAPGAGGEWQRPAAAAALQPDAAAAAARPWDVLAGSSSGDATDLTFDQVVFWYSDNVSSWAPYNGRSVGWPQSMPATNFWYPYKRRPNEAGRLPDEDPVLLAASLAAHAAELSTAGVDYVLGDGTNLSEWPCAPDDAQCQPDLLQLRPFEVVTEAWAALRGAGHATPDFGVWGRANNGDGPIWREYLARLAYNATSIGGLAQLAPVSPVARKPLFLLASSNPATLNATLAQEIMAAGSVQVAPAWVCMGGGPDSCVADEWLFEAPCVVPDPARPASNNTLFTSYVHPDEPCGHYIVTPPAGSLSAPLGSMTTISFSTGWNSQAFIAPGKVSGLLVIKMFEDIWAAPPGSVRNIFIPSFNEYFIGAQNFTNFQAPNVYAGAMGGSSGSDGTVLPSTRALWVDGFADGRSRAFEPTVADGGAALELLASCLRVTALVGLRGWAPAPGRAPRGGAPCSVAGEACCAYSASMYTTPVWSLERRASDGRVDDALATSDAALVERALADGGYTQMPYPWAGAGAYILPPSVGGAQLFGGHPDATAPNNYSLAVRGPFLIYANDTASAGIPSARPLFLCETPGGGHFLATAAACDGAGDVVGLQGYVAGARSGAMPRALRGCANSSGGGSPLRYHAVDGPCAPGDAHLGLLGFVM